MTIESLFQLLCLNALIKYLTSFREELKVFLNIYLQNSSIMNYLLQLYEITVGHWPFSEDLADQMLGPIYCTFPIPMGMQ